MKSSWKIHIQKKKKHLNVLMRIKYQSGSLADHNFNDTLVLCKKKKTTQKTQMIYQQKKNWPDYS